MLMVLKDLTSNKLVYISMHYDNCNFNQVQIGLSHIVTRAHRMSFRNNQLWGGGG